MEENNSESTREKIRRVWERDHIMMLKVCGPSYQTDWVVGSSSVTATTSLQEVSPTGGSKESTSAERPSETDPGPYMDSMDRVPDTLIYCIECFYPEEEDCVQGPLNIVTDKKVYVEDEFRALKTAPPELIIKKSDIPGAGKGVFARATIPQRTRFGPFKGVNVPLDQGTKYSWLIRKDGEPSHCIDGTSPFLSNWMRYVNCARTEKDWNLYAFQYKGEIFFRTVREVNPGEELCVWCGDEYGRALGIDPEDVAPWKFTGPVMWVDHPLKYSLKERTMLKREETSGKKAPSHEEGRMTACPICLKSFPSKKAVRRHQLTQHTQKIFFCNYCEHGTVSFGSNALLIKHFMVHCRKDLKCIACEKVFRKKCELQYHIREHFGEKLTTNVCTRCLEGFPRPDVLQRHKKLCRTSKPLCCSICRTSCVDRLKLREHLACHRIQVDPMKPGPQKKWRCLKCPGTFFSKWYAEIHDYNHRD